MGFAMDKEQKRLWFDKWQREAGLLRLVDFLLFLKNMVRTIKPNRLFLSRNREFPVPPYFLSYDAYGHTNWNAYYRSGLEHAKFLSGIIRELIPADDVSVLEWGCGPARIIRHMPGLLDYPGARWHGTDYNGKTIAWCRKNIRGISFSENRLSPPLPFEAGQFDCVYNISVFTHLSEGMHFAWMEELSRIMKPGGIIIMTTHGDFFRKELLEHERRQYDSGQLVVRGKAKEGTKIFSAFQPPRFMREVLLRDFEVLRHLPSPEDALLTQDVWVVRKAA